MAESASSQEKSDKGEEKIELNPDALFDAFLDASQLQQTLEVFSKLCQSVNIDQTDYKNVFQNLKDRLTSWKCQTLWKRLDKRVGLDTYKKKPCHKNRVLVLGCGPCGLRVAIEAALLGAHVVITEKRACFSRNNVLHLWPFLIYDLKNLGAKKFFGKFCAGTLDHISIRRLQLILLKVALILGVQVYSDCLFVGLKEPSEKKGWTARIKPENHPASKFEFDVVMGTDGRRHTLKGFRRKEFRGKLAIAITMNFVNRNTKAEARVQEISGVAFIFNQGFFTDLKDETGIDLENIVYYKDETHYFVMTAKKQSLLLKGVLKKDCADPGDLLAKDNVSRENLLEYARQAANFCTNKQLPHMDFALTPQNEEDIAMFDFTSMYAAENAAMIVEMKGKRLLMSLAGDSLMEPFWPTGSGCARGFLAVFDAAWMMRGWGLGHSPIDLIMEREGIYKLLAQTTASSVSKNYDDYTIDPRSRYPNATIRKAPKDRVKHLYKIIENSLEEINDNKPEPMDISMPANIGNKVSPDLLLSWCQKHTKGYKNVHIKDMSSSWKNGLAFCALIHRFRPELLNFEHLNEDDVEKNNELAFNVAEKELGIPPQISASEMAQNEKTDLLTIVTYLTQYYETFKDEKPVTPSSPGDEKSPDKHKSPLSKLSVISRISMKKKPISPGWPESRVGKGGMVERVTEQLRRRSTTDTSYRRREWTGRGCAWLARRNVGKEISEETDGKKGEVDGKKYEVDGKKYEVDGKKYEVDGKKDEVDGKKYEVDGKKYEVDGKKYEVDGKKDEMVGKEVMERNLERRFAVVAAAPRMVGGWLVVWFVWLVMLLPRLFIFIFMKKRKHTAEARSEKSSKKYKVSDEKKRQQSADDVELKSYTKHGNGDVGVSTRPPLELATMKSNKKIGELAELVFGEQPKSSRTPKMTTPIRRNRSSHGDSEHCHFCNEKIFVFERLSAEGFFFHRKCFKCEHCEVTLRLGNYGYVPPEEGTPGKFYCKQHYRKIFYETPGKSPSQGEDVVDAPRQSAHRSHSIGNIQVSRPTVVKPIDFETPEEMRSPPKKVLEVPKSLRDEISKDRAHRTRDVSPDLCNVSLSSEEMTETPQPKNTRQPVYHKYMKYEAKPLRRSSVASNRKSEKDNRRRFVQRSQAPAQKAPQESAMNIVLSDEAPPKPPRAHQLKEQNVTEYDEISDTTRGRRSDSTRAKYPPSSAFPDSFLVTKAVDIPLDDNAASPGGDVSRDLRECLGESTPRKVNRLPSVAGQVVDPKKHWTTYYRTAGSFDTTNDKDVENIEPDTEPAPPSPPVSPPSPLFVEDPQRTLTTLHEDREMSPTSPKKTWWPFSFGGHKKEKKSKEEKVKEKKLKEEKHKEHKKEKKEKKKRKKGKKMKQQNEVEDEMDQVDENLSDEDEGRSPDDGRSPVTSEVDSPGYFESSDEEEDLPEAIRLARVKAKRYQMAEKQREEVKRKKCEEFHIRLEMRQREQKRLRIAQSIQRELDEVEVRQMELEKRGVKVEKKMEQLEAGKPQEERKLVLEWFDLVNRKNTLIRYESELVIHSNSIELEDQQQRLEQQIRTLLMNTETNENDQIKIEQLTRELVDIVEQRNTLVELLEHDRKREQEEDEMFEMTMASKGFSLNS